MLFRDVPVKIILPCKAAFCTTGRIAAARMIAVETLSIMFSLVLNQILFLTLWRSVKDLPQLGKSQSHSFPGSVLLEAKLESLSWTLLPNHPWLVCTVRLSSSEGLVYSVVEVEDGTVEMVIDSVGAYTIPVSAEISSSIGPPPNSHALRCVSTKWSLLAGSGWYRSRHPSLV